MRAESACRYCSTRGTKQSRFVLPLVEAIVGSIVEAISGLLLLGLLTVPAFAQGSGQGPSGLPADIEASEMPAGRVIDNYVIMQSVEVGYRLNSINGSTAMYDTLLNDQSGVRLFQQSLMIRPMPDAHAPFDNLYLESFGWGGDPSNAARFRISKRGIYNLGATFRRDQNYFNYDLLANPLNSVSTTALPTIFVDNSPHSMNLRRRMYNVDLVLLPQHTLSFHFEFSRNRNEGPSFSSVHQGTEALLNQQFNTTEDAVRMGAAWRVLPRTTLTYTQSLRFLKNDTDQTLATFNTILAANGTPIEFGLPWLNGSPCAAPIVGGFANPACNGYLAYTRTMRYRNYLPTEQLNLTSSSIHNVEFTGRFMYSNADANTPLNENFNGLISRTGVVQSNTNGTTAHASWVSEDGDAGVTVHLGSHLRLVDSFRFYAFRLPGTFDLIQNNFFNLGTAVAPNILLPTAVYPPVLPLHSASSPPDVQNDIYTRFVQQTTKSNEFSIHYDVSRNFGVRIGYLYRNIFDAHHWLSVSNPDTYYPDPRGVAISTCLGLGGTLNGNGTCTVFGVFDSENEPVTINQHWGIGGLWYRTAKFRADAEVRLMSADNFLTRIDPLHERQYRANASYTPEPWLTVAANFNIREQRNPTQDFAYNAHVRNFGFNAIATPNSRIAVDAAYNYTSTLQNNNICYAGTFIAPGSSACVNDNTLNEVLGFYSNRTHYGMADIMFKPVSRISATAGYSIIDVDGNTQILNPLQPLGPLSYRYHQPLAALGIGITKQVELRAGWNYYQYNENSFTGPTAPRYFHANLTNLSLKYSF